MRTERNQRAYDRIQEYVKAENDEETQKVLNLIVEYLETSEKNVDDPNHEWHTKCFEVLKDFATYTHYRNR